MKTVYIGLDVGSSTCVARVLDGSGKVIHRSEFETGERNLIEAIQEIPGNAIVHLEASELAGWIREILMREKGRVQRVIVSDPKANSLISKDPNKSDESDAYNLADLARMGRFKEVYYPDDRGRAEFKMLVQHHARLGVQSVRVQHHIKSCLRRLGVIIKDRKLFSEEGRVPVLNQVASEIPHKILREHYAIRDCILKQRKEALRLIRRESKKYPEIALLSEIPGVKCVLASRFSAYVQTPFRFGSRKKLARYSRLNIVDRTSNGKPLGYKRLERQGNGPLKDLSRKVFNATCKRGKKENAFYRSYMKSLATTHDEVHARLSTQRKILSVMAAIWRTKLHYDDSRG
jgi:transposase